MEPETILIAGFSGRALAQSARRAGFVPLVVDGFGDEDMRAAAGDSEHLPEIVTQGFTARALTAALDRLAEAAATPPVGLVLGAGFEDVPALVGRLEERYTLLGCAAETIRGAKDPVALASLLRGRGIAHPETRIEAPDDTAGWLTKRIGGTGGTHILPAKPAARSGRYFQREIAGVPVSALGIVGASDCAFAFSRQWTAAGGPRPYRYGGATGSLELDADLEARLIEIALELSRDLSLIGLVSLDFIITPDATPVLLEINPRPGATVDVFDDEAGTLFKAHLAASRGTGSLDAYFAAWSPPVARAVAYLYADRGDLVVPHVDWPDWALDRPPAGRSISRHQPIATVTAIGADTRQAEALCRERMGTLERVLYEDMTEKDAQS